MLNKYYLKRTWQIVLLVLLLPAMSMAQAIIVSGTVTDAADRSPLPGVSVLVKKSTRGTATNVDGTYTLNVIKETPLNSLLLVTKPPTAMLMAKRC